MALFPEELTFGVFDAAVIEKPIQNPIVWLWQVHLKNGKAFASLIDGGSIISSNSSNSYHFLLRSMTTSSDCVLNDEEPHRGDVVKLLEYSWRRVVGRLEIILVISRMSILRHCYEQVVALPKPMLMAYPYEEAVKVLSVSEKCVWDNTSKLEKSELNLKSEVCISTSCNFNNSHAMPVEIDKNCVSSKSHLIKQAPNSKRQVNPNIDDFYNKNSYNIRDVEINSEILTKPASKRGLNSSIKKDSLVKYAMESKFLEIKDLNPFSSKWIVRGRFVNKGQIRTYSNQRGEGKIWGCDLVDSSEESSMISCTFFNKAVDKFFPMIIENNVYTVSKGIIKPVNRKFNVSYHQFELHLAEDAEIVWVASDDSSIPLRIVPNIISIANLTKMTKQTPVSVCGIVINIGNLTEIVARSSGQLRLKREIRIIDESEYSIDITFWGTKTSLINLIECLINPIVLIENVKIDEFNGIRLSSTNQTNISVNPRNADSERLFFTLSKNKKTILSKDINTLTTTSVENSFLPLNYICEVSQLLSKVSIPDYDEKGFFFVCKATLTNIDHARQFYWDACPTCGKKVQMSSNTKFNVLSDQHYNLNPTDEENVSNYNCIHCKVNVKNPIKKYLLNIDIVDPTGSLRCSVLGDRGNSLMGNIKVEELYDIQQSIDITRYQQYDDFFVQRLFRDYIFKIHMKPEMYRDETRIKYRIIGVDPINSLAQGENSTNNFYNLCTRNLNRYIVNNISSMQKIHNFNVI